jgi:hypothetical protein
MSVLRRFVLLVPLAWVLVTIGARVHRGDEYGAFLVATVVAWPLGFLLKPLALWDHVGALGAAWICGLPVLLLLGWWMDRARASWRLALGIWFLLALLVAAAEVLEYESLAQAVGKNGSLWAYVFAGLGATLPVACFLSAVLSRRPPAPRP